MSELNLEEAFEPTDVEIPAALPVLPLKETVIFPQSVSPLAIGQERSIKLVDDVVAGERVLALVSVKNSEVEQPGWDDLYEVGTAAIVHKMIRVPDGTLRILVQGVGRIRLERRLQDEPYLVGEFAELPDVIEETPELEALTRSVQSAVRPPDLGSSHTCRPSSSSLRPTWTTRVRSRTSWPRRSASRPRRSSELLEQVDVERAPPRRARASSGASSRSSSSARRSSPRCSRSWRRASASTSCASS